MHGDGFRRLELPAGSHLCCRTRAGCRGARHRVRFRSGRPMSNSSFEPPNRETPMFRDPDFPIDRSPCVKVVVASSYHRSSKIFRTRDDMMTKAYSLAFKQKMVERLTGKNAVNPSELSREIGIRQQNLSRWLHEARSLPSVASNTPKARVWTVEQKAQALAGASKLSGEQLTSYLEREGIKLADFERWRIALEEDGRGSIATTKRIRKLERELARQ